MSEQNSNNISANNKRIAKNTIALYFRTFISMIVGLYTSRVMLQALGIEDYGIYAVVGGIVSMSALITNMMSASISRYITYSLGVGDREQLKTIFSTSINAQIVMAIIVAIVLEVGGVWFLNSEASIPLERIEAANLVLHFSIVTLMVSMISSPFNATIIAHERMSVYAYISIVDAILKLAICFIVKSYEGDNLILFSFLHIVLVVLVQIFYGFYCCKHFEEAHYRFYIFDKKLLTELSVFSGWTLLNSGAWTFSTQGVNMLVNVFFGVTFNASRSIATTVNSTIQSFVNNFTTAFAPQITKNYATGNIKYSVYLVNRGTKITLLMLLVFIVPVYVETDTLLVLWLGEVPPYSSLFVRLSMIETLTISMGSNLLRLIQANGNLKFYSISTALWSGLVFPIIWILFYMDFPVWSAYIVFIVIFFTQNYIRILAIKRLIDFSFYDYIKVCIIPFLVAAFFSLSLPVIISFSVKQSVFRFCILIPFSIIWTLFCCFIFGLSSSEKMIAINKIKFYVKRIIKCYIK